MSEADCFHLVAGKAVADAEAWLRGHVNIGFLAETAALGIESLRSTPDGSVEGQARGVLATMMLLGTCKLAATLPANLHNEARALIAMHCVIVRRISKTED